MSWKDKANLFNNILNCLDNNYKNDSIKCLNKIIPNVKNILVYGTEKDENNEEFIKASVNENNNNFKNPSTGIYHPSKEIEKQLSNEEINLEKELNLLLKKHINFYYLNNTIGNCFIKDKKYYFIIFKKIENKENIKNLEFKSITEIDIKTIEDNKNIIFQINANTTIDYNIILNEEEKELNNKNEFKGSLKNKLSYQKIFTENKINIEEKDIVYYLGKNFIKIDTQGRIDLENLYIKKLIYNSKNIKKKDENIHLNNLANEFKNLITSN